jgi:sucrose phosphorylase
MYRESKTMIKNMSSDILEQMRKRFNRLYGKHRADQCLERLAALVGRYGIGYNRLSTRPRWDEKRTVLITYGDMVQREGERPLVTLKQFADRHLCDVIDSIHILPFCPWSSDDGFSVIDYRQVSPDLGHWKDVQAIGDNFNLMFDLVLNHCSRKGEWFRNYTAGVAPHRDYFIEMDPHTDLSAVVRPRSTPVLTSVHKNMDEAHVWATFSSDQIDLNFANPDVLFEFFDILMLYLSRGVKIIRLDAIAYLWKQPGTSCIHLEQTHEVVKLFRDLLDMIAPEVVLLTETNVPHEENISYFGREDEAHMVYQFSLPPLLLHALTTGNAAYLADWAQTVSVCPENCTYLNFTASHDGIGVRPLTGLIPDSEFAALVDHVKAQGGHVSTKRNSDGTESPYELNITYFDALGGDDFQIDRFLCSQTVMLALKGVPAIYFHSLTATPNDHDGVEATGRARSINRRKWDADELENELKGKGTTARVFSEYQRRLKIRTRQKAFHPDAHQRVVELGNGLFGFVRVSTDSKQIIVCVSNVSNVRKSLVLNSHFPELDSPKPLTDLLSGARTSGADKKIPLDPYQTVWLTAG